MTAAAPGDAGRSLRQVVLSSVGARAANVLLGALAGVIVARVLAPDGRGAYAVVVTAAGTAVALSHLSIEQAHLALWRETDRRRAIVANAVALSLVMGVLAALAAFVVVQALGAARLPVYSDVGLAVALAAVPAALLALYTNSLVALSSRVDALNRGMLLSAVSQTLALVGLAAVDRLTVTAVVVVWALTTAVPLLVTLPVLRPRVRDLSVQVLRAEVSRGLRYHAGVALLFLLFRVDVFLVNGYRTQEEVGLYALAVTLAELVYLVSDSVAQAIVARQASGDEHASTAVTTLAMRVTLCGGGVAVAGLAAVSPVLVPAVYGEAFAGSVPALLVLLPGVLALAVSRPVTALLAARDLPRVVVALSVGAFLLNVVLAVLLIPRLGIVGASLASTLAYGCLCLGYLLAARRVAGLAWSEFVPRASELRVLAQRG